MTLKVIRVQSAVCVARLERSDFQSVGKALDLQWFEIYQLPNECHQGLSECAPHIHTKGYQRESRSEIRQDASLLGRPILHVPSRQHCT